MSSLFHGCMRFNVKAMLIAVMFAALLLGVWAERARKQRAGVAWVREQLPGTKWLRNLLGIDYFAMVTGVVLDRDTIYDLAPMTNLSGLESVGLMVDVNRRTDLSPLNSLKRLKLLRLDYTGLEMAQLLPMRAALSGCRIESATNPELNAAPSR